MIAPPHNTESTDRPAAPTASGPASWWRRIEPATKGVLLVLALLTPLTVLVVLETVEEQRAARLTAARHATAITRLSAERVRGNLLEVRSAMGAVARVHRERMDGSGTPGPAATEWIEDIRELHPAMLSLSLLAPDGRILGSSRTRLAPPSAPPLDADQDRLLHRSGWHYSRPSAATDDSGAFVIRRLARNTDGQVIGVVVSQVDAALLTDPLGDAEIGTRAVLAVVSALDGSPLAIRGWGAGGPPGWIGESIRAAVPALTAGNPHPLASAEASVQAVAPWLGTYETLEREHLIVMAWFEGHPMLDMVDRELALKAAGLVFAAALFWLAWFVRSRWMVRLSLEGAAGADAGTGGTLALSRSMERRERELAQELHDGVCQQLTGVAFLVDVVRRRTDAGDVAAARELPQVVDLLRAAIDQTRAVVRGLRPVADGRRALSQALETLGERMETAYGVSVDVFNTAPDVDLGAETANHVYRITEEAVSNAMRHAQPTRVEIRVAAQEARFELEVWNDGQMPAASKLQSGAGFGLQSMRARAAAIDAALVIQFAAPEGFLVRLSVPIRSTPSEASEQA